MSFTVEEWCKRRKISRASLYRLWREKRGPAFHYNGIRRLISEEADAEWVRQQEAAARQVAAA
jgi:hypothetical protein